MKTNKLSFILIIILLAGLLFFIWNSKSDTNENKIPETIGTPYFSDPLNGTYEIDGEKITLVNGTAEVEVAPGSASKNTYSIFGTPVVGDISGDEKPDQVFFVIEETAGTATFMYVVAAVSIDGKYYGTDAVSLGDRIVPKSIVIKDSVATVSYVTRKDDEPMTSEPTINVTKYLNIKIGKLMEIVR